MPYIPAQSGSLHTLGGKLLRNPVTGALCSTCCRDGNIPEDPVGIVVAILGRTFAIGLHLVKYFPFDDFPEDMFTPAPGFIVGTEKLIGVAFSRKIGYWELQISVSVDGTISGVDRHYTGTGTFTSTEKTGAYSYKGGLEWCTPVLVTGYPPPPTLPFPRLYGTTAIVTEYHE